MMTQKRIATAAVLGIAFLSWVIIAASPTSRTELWYERSQIYLNAIRSGDLAQTYTQYHPGATVMAVGAASLQVHDLVPLPTGLLLPESTNSLGQSMAVVTWGQGLMMVGTMVGIAFTVRALTDEDWLPVAVMGLMAFSPFLLSNMRSIHLDAPLALFMVLSALLILVYRQHGGWIWLVGSAAVGGLALLTKSPAVFLLPYVGLVLLTHAVESIVRAEHKSMLLIASTVLREIALPLLAWVAVAGVVFFVCFPAMWVQPLIVLREIADAAVLHAEAPHPNPIFFAGDLYTDRLTPLHYPITMGFLVSGVVFGLGL
ncbi:MAG: ArnT family glycosyltransferase [Anaerolineae bacterium]